jgi:L-fuculose-phosphate aldolase
VYASEYQLRQELIRVTRIVTEQGLVCSSDGNISMRLDNNHFLMTPTGLYKMGMATEDPIVVNWEGEVVKGKPGYQPTSEFKMHLEVYRQRPDLNAVLHAHPPYCIALTVANIPFPTMLVPEVLMAIGEVPTAPYARPGTEDLVSSVSDLIIDHDSILLSHHGSVNASETLEGALIALERMEHTAKIYYLASSMGELVPLPADEIQALKSMGEARRDKTAV